MTFWGQNYSERGTWQFDGTNFAQQWTDPGTGEAMSEVYRLEFTSGTTMVISEGNFDTPMTFTKAAEQTTTAPSSETPASPTNPLIPASSADLVGSWWTQNGNVVIIQTINEDGNYTFEAPSQNYFEKGKWQLDGTNFSQQWQDSSTGEAKEETYTVELLSKDSIKMSGGNLGDTVFTFNRGTPPESATTSAGTGEIRAASGPPQAGDYLCTVLGLVSSMRTEWRFDPILGGRLELVPYLNAQLQPSVLGMLRLDGKGNFTQTNGEKGTYSYDEATKQVTFTGFLGSLPVRYSGDSFVFTYTGSEGSQDHTCSK